EDILKIGAFRKQPADEIAQSVKQAASVTKGHEREQKNTDIDEKNADYVTLEDTDENQTKPQKLCGIMMMQPYDPNKIPVVMVHGLASSPMTWMEMFNSLRGIPEIREKYQFWFYFYPSVQPFWVSAAQLRDDLAEIRATLDPNDTAPALHQMTLVGHSMGGLIARMQTIESGDSVWNLVSDVPFEQLDEPPEVKNEIKKWFFFSPDPSIHRVITIATPFHGSDFANNFTQWLANRVVHLPQSITNVADSFAIREDGVLKKGSLLHMETSIESLSPKNPLFKVISTDTRAPDAEYNNIVGLVNNNGLLKYFNTKSDGVVRYESATFPEAESEITVPSMHSYVHTHPRAIMEVRRILLENEPKESKYSGNGINSQPIVR
ncbi:MAG: esterase/lipase family protein, partial [Thermoguttaceae bacterium]